MARTRSVRGAEIDRGEWMPFARAKVVAQALALTESRSSVRAADGWATRDPAPACRAAAADRG